MLLSAEHVVPVFQAFGTVLGLGFAGFGGMVSGLRLIPGVGASVLLKGWVRSYAGFM